MRTEQQKTTVIQFITSKLVEIVIVSFLLLLGTGCQTEIDITEGTSPDQNTNTANSQTTNSFRRISMFDGSSDDIIDNNPCSLVVLPVSLTANGVPLTINTPADLSQVESIFNQSSSDNDTVVFDFPIQVLNYNHTSQDILNQAEFDTLVVQCNELILNNNGPITCVDFSYPLQFTIYNTNLNLYDIVQVDTDIQLFNFIENLLPDDIFSADFPFTAIEVGPINVVVNSNNELETIIANCVN